MFFGVRSFESNLGVSVANILFPSLLVLGMSVDHPIGIRMSAIVSIVICAAGLGVFFLYDERAVLRSLAKKEKLSSEEIRGGRQPGSGMSSTGGSGGSGDRGIGIGDRGDRGDRGSGGSADTRAPAGTRYWIVAHTHWDREWYLSFQDFRWKLVHAVDRVIDTLSTDPSFCHFMLDGQTVVLDDYLALRPERSETLQGLVAAGKLSVGPWYIQPDDILVTGEALVRNLTRGLACARALGAPMMVGYLPDSFGHIGSLPAVLAGFGIGAAGLMRGPGASLDKVFFRWSAKDGSQVLVAYLIDGYGNGAELPMEAASIGAALDELRERQEGSLVPGVPLLVMNGIDHRSIDAELPGVLAAADLRDEARIGSLEEYIASSRALLPDAIPRWQGELRSVYRCPITVGCTSARHWIKREDQAVSTLLERRAEPLAALASLLGAPYPRAAIDLAWRYLLLNQPHDSICGCSIDPVHDDMRYRYAQARGLAANIADDAARFIAGQAG